MKRYSSIPLILAMCLTSCSGPDTAIPLAGSFSEEEFAAPPIQYRPIPLWFWNNTAVDIEGVTSQLHGMVEKDGYGGCAIIPFGRNFRPEYLSDGYMRIYAAAVAAADSLGAKMSLYDEYGFPSGSMGFSNADGVPRFKDAHPENTIRRLDKFEKAVGCGETVEIALDTLLNTFRYPSPVEAVSTLDGTLMAAAAYDAESRSSIGIRDCICDGKLTWTAPDHGDWTVMVFKCFEDGKPRVNYLDPEAAELFIRDVHERYHSLFGDRFGTVITSTFFDEPTMYYAQGRMWTERFNDEFRARCGMESDAFYPALWYDIGESTSAVRNMMYGVHSALYAEGFTKTIAEWAESHGIASTGHQDQEEIANTTGVSGDLMLHGRYMTVPGIDKIGGDRPAELFYKVVSSSAANWDKTEVMSETFGAMGNIPVEEMYRIAIEQYTKGITNLIPHAVWYDDTDVTFLPELSWRNPLYSGELPAFNAFLSRLRYVLARPGRHVADIAMLYPVQTQYAGHTFDGELGPIRGSVKVEGTDYPEVSRILTDELGKDFTYIHPSVLDDRCRVSGGRLHMTNRVNSEHFSAIILPGVRAISLSNLRKVEDAWKHGVKVIFTTQLPCESADYGVDNAVIAETVSRMLRDSRGHRSAIFVQDPTPESLGAALAGMDADISFISDKEPFNYIHKVIATDDGETDVFLIGNIDDQSRSQEICLRGGYSSVRLLDPHSGRCSDVRTLRSGGKTDFTLELQPSASVIILAK